MTWGKLHQATNQAFDNVIIDWSWDVQSIAVYTDGSYINCPTLHAASRAAAFVGILSDGEEVFIGAIADVFEPNKDNAVGADEVSSCKC